jgi:hypothetical protein
MATKIISFYNLYQLRKAFEIILKEQQISFEKVYVFHQSDFIAVHIETQDQDHNFKLTREDIVNKNMLIIAEEQMNQLHGVR